MTRLLKIWFRRRQWAISPDGLVCLGPHRFIVFADRFDEIDLVARMAAKTRVDIEDFKLVLEVGQQIFGGMKIAKRRARNNRSDDLRALTEAAHGVFEHYLVTRDDLRNLPGTHARAIVGG